MPHETKPLPPDLTDRVRGEYPSNYTVRFIRAERVLSDAWSGTAFLFEGYDPRIIPKSASHLRGCAFQLNQFDPTSKWTWELIDGPAVSDCKSAVLRALRNSN